MATLASTKGDTADELRRIKQKSRKTQGFLSESKKVQSSTIKGGDTMTSPERSMKANQTMLSGGSSSGAAATGLQSIIVDLLLFGKSAGMKKGMSMTQSFSVTTSSAIGHVNQVAPLRYVLRNAPILDFEIAVTNSDGTRKTDD